MNFFRRLFGGGGGGDQRVAYYYIRPRRCDEIVEVRIDLYNELSQSDEGGYFVRKIARGARCPFPAELNVSFDDNRRAKQVSVENGETVEEAEYQAWLAQRQTAKGG